MVRSACKKTPMQTKSRFKIVMFVSKIQTADA